MVRYALLSWHRVRIDDRGPEEDASGLLICIQSFTTRIASHEVAIVKTYTVRFQNHRLYVGWSCCRLLPFGCRVS